jgi:hypothetical protein
MDFEFGDVGADLNFLDSPIEEVYKSNKITTLPTTKLKRKGLHISQINDNTFKIKATKRNVQAKLLKAKGTDYISQIIMECMDERECSLRKTSKLLWDIDRVADNVFILRSK